MRINNNNIVFNFKRLNIGMSNYHNGTYLVNDLNCGSMMGVLKPLEWMNID